MNLNGSLPKSSREVYPSLAYIRIARARLDFTVEEQFQYFVCLYEMNLIQTGSLGKRSEHLVE